MVPGRNVAARDDVVVPEEFTGRRGQADASIPDAQTKILAGLLGLCQDASPRTKLDVARLQAALAGWDPGSPCADILVDMAR